ncbi:MAG TPA: anti-sigma factor [Microscillaceae bacterium]|nr:anti-sigma factor [Microscillaceae bacterium]
MNEERYQILMTEYLSGEITPEHEAELKAYLEQNEEGKSELFELKILNDQLGHIEVPEPSEQMSANFYTMLEEHKQAEQNTLKLSTRLKSWWDSLNYRRLAYNLAYGLVGILIGGLGMYWLQDTATKGDKNLVISKKNEEQWADVKKQLARLEAANKEVMLTLIKEKSASERLRAVNLTSNLSDVDNRIIEALLTTLNTDSNVNVRLTTVEALSQFTKHPKVRTGLIKAIAKQDSPLVQIALVDIMIDLQEKRSVNALKELLKKQDLNEAVKGKVEQGIQVLM